MKSKGGCIEVLTGLRAEKRREQEESRLANEKRSKRLTPIRGLAS